MFLTVERIIKEKYLNEEKKERNKLNIIISKQKIKNAKNFKSLSLFSYFWFSAVKFLKTFKTEAFQQKCK